MSKALSVRDFQFEGKPVRTVGTDRDLWFVAQDVCNALGIEWRGKATLTSIPDDWISVRRLRTDIPQRNGMNRVAMMETYIIRESAVYKLAFRSNKPQADAFTNWVAGEVLPAIREKGIYVSRRQSRYLSSGKPPGWIAERVEGIDARKSFTDVLKTHGVEKAGYGICTNAIYRPTIGASAQGALMLRGLKPKDNLRDNLSQLELAKVKLSELLAAVKIDREELNGNERCATACRISGEAVAQASLTAINTPTDRPQLPQ